MPQSKQDAAGSVSTAPVASRRASWQVLRESALEPADANTGDCESMRHDMAKVNRNRHAAYLAGMRTG